MTRASQTAAATSSATVMTNGTDGMNPPDAGIDTALVLRAATD